jgi:F-type H+-transporting ATPase subunit b
MRTRLLLSGLAVATIGLLGPMATAHAQDEGSDVELTEENQECLELLEEGKDVDDCQEAPSPILPAANEMIWGALAFVVLLALMTKFAFPALKTGMEGRTERIRADVDAAEAAKVTAESRAAEYEARLAEARQEAARIIEEARQDADGYRTQKRSEIDAEIVRLREQAQADIESSKAQAIADIRGEVATLAVAAAEQVVSQNLDRDANLALVEQFIDSVGAQGSN